MRGSLITPRRLAMAGVSVLSLAICLGLAWWQWRRFESATGTWQNLGYVLQWPLFGLFPAFLFWRMSRLRRRYGAETAPAEVAQPARPAAEPAAPARTGVAPPPRVIARQYDDDDPELAAYNRFLAQLNARDQQESR